MSGWRGHLHMKLSEPILAKKENPLTLDQEEKEAYHIMRLGLIEELDDHWQGVAAQLSQWENEDLAHALASVWKIFWRGGAPAQPKELPDG